MWFVFVECCRLGIPWLGVVHDLSKFSPAEFLYYARNFYGEWPDQDSPDVRASFLGAGVTLRTKQDVKCDFDFAWLHHQNTNKHHPEYWQLRARHRPLEELPMPDRYRREMLADWIGAGRAYQNPDTRGWYFLNRKSIKLHPDTRAWVEEQLGVTNS